MATNLISLGCHRPRKRTIQYTPNVVIGSAVARSLTHEILDAPLEPVIGPAGGRTHWRSMTAQRV